MRLTYEDLSLVAVKRPAPTASRCYVSEKIPSGTRDPTTAPWFTVLVKLSNPDGNSRGKNIIETVQKLNPFVRKKRRDRGERR